MSAAHRSGRVRAIGALLLALFVCGQAYAVAHRALVRHEVCYIDGEVVHGYHGHDLAPTEVHDSEETEGPAVTAAEGEEEHAEHCSVVLLRDPRKCVFEPVTLDMGLAARKLTVAALRSQALGSRIPVLRFAPKQSPPRAA